MTEQFGRMAVERRGLLGSVGVGIAGAALGGAGLTLTSTPAAAWTYNDAEILNFALNLEYLEAEYYMRALTGSGLPSSMTSGSGTQGKVTGGAAVKFRFPLVHGFAKRIAADEVAHVAFLRKALGSDAVAEPSIDLESSFNTLAAAAGLIQSGGTFDPFADDLSFLLGAFIFEDVGVTAYAGAAPLLTNAANVGYAARILGTEGYHAGALRGILSEVRQGKATDAIAALRQKLSGVQDSGTDIDSGSSSTSFEYNISDVDSNGLALARTTGQVLAIVYGGGKTGGLFYPSGVNGSINTATPAS
jgi:hypothetical protein